MFPANSVLGLPISFFPSNGRPIVIRERHLQLHLYLTDRRSFFLLLLNLLKELLQHAICSINGITVYPT